MPISRGDVQYNPAPAPANAPNKYIKYGHSVGHSVNFDRSGFDLTMAQLRHADIDGAVQRAADRYMVDVKADTPVLTGRLQKSVARKKNATADHSVFTEVEYSHIVESRPPGKFAKPGAMFAKNLAKGQAYLDEECRAALGRAT